MKLGLAVEYAGRGVTVPIDLIQRCEALGYDSVWTAEALRIRRHHPPRLHRGPHAERIRLGTGGDAARRRAPPPWPPCSSAPWTPWPGAGA